MIGWVYALVFTRALAADPAPTDVPSGSGRAPSVDLAEEADLQFRLGVAAYRSGELTSALEHLLASHRLVPNRNVVFNLARTYEELGQLDSAWRYYDQYVRTETDPTARAEADQALLRLGPKVARVKVDTDPPGATGLPRPDRPREPRRHPADPGPPTGRTPAPARARRVPPDPDHGPAGHGRARGDSGGPRRRQGPGGRGRLAVVECLGG